MFLDYIEKLKPGYDADKLASETGIQSPKNSDLFIQYNDLCCIFENVAKQLAMSDFGLQLAMLFPASMPQLGAFTALRFYSKNVKDWYSLGSKYLKLHTNAIAFNIEENSSEDIFHLICSYGSEVPEHKQMFQYQIMLIYRSITENLTSEYRFPKELRLPKPKEFYDPKIANLIKSKIIYNAEKFELIFDKRLLTERINCTSSVFHELATTYSNFSKKDMSSVNSSMKEFISCLIFALLGTGRCNMEEVSRILSITSKSLQRLLDAENTTFSKILEERRRYIALNMLENTKIPIQEIAYFLDYSSPKSFSLAFKRWINKSPSDYRQSYSKNKMPNKY